MTKFRPLYAILFFFSQITNKPSCLHSPALSPRTQGGWLCKLGLTATGHSQSVLAVCFWFVILNCFDCCNGALQRRGFLLQGELARTIYVGTVLVATSENSNSDFEIKRSFFSNESQRVTHALHIGAGIDVKLCLLSSNLTPL